MANQNLSLNMQVREALSKIGSALQILARAGLPEDFHAQQPSAFKKIVATPDDDFMTVAALTNEFLRAKARAERSDRYLRALRNSLVKFAHGRANLPVASITVGEVERWIHGQNWAIRTKHGYLGDVRTLFNYAMKRGYVAKNPASPVELPPIPENPVGIHTPSQVRAVLQFARCFDVNVMRALAVRYYAGLRSAEVEKLKEEKIGAKYIEVSAADSKTRRRRLVNVQPVLAYWLSQGGQLPVLGCQSNIWRDFTVQMTKATGVPWLHNVTRHSFVSYHLANFGNAGQTALQAGHTEAMLFYHYRELVTAEDAAEYWSVPASGQTPLVA